MRSDRSKWRFVPRLEACEGRDCPSVSAVITGAALTIQGDGGNDTVTLRYTNGQVEATISGPGGTATASGTVSAITVLTRGGSDRVEYDGITALTAGLAVTVNLGSGRDSGGNTNSVDFDQTEGVTSAALSLVVTGAGGLDDAQVRLGTLNNANVVVTATMGNGADTFNTDLTGDLLGGSSLTVVGVGGTGNDTMSVGQNASAYDIAATARVNVNLNGGSGFDRLSTFARGTNDGQFAAILVGGAANDTVTIDVDGGAGTGRVTASAQGLAGSDTLALTVDSAGPVDATIIGGSGIDSATRTSNVVVTGVENVSTVPAGL
jgi:hypothetical protein